MNLESNEPGSGTLASKLGVDLDRAQYKNAGPESQSPTAGQVKRELYMLAIVDETTGTPIRVATEEDLSDFDVNLIDRSLTTSPTPSKKTSPLTPKSGIGYDGCGFGAFNRQKSLQELLANAKGGPRCHNCGVKESPQWRKGPEEKPILCNACGTRYRRTNQFAPLSSHHPTSRKRPLQSVATRLLDNKVGNENKAPRIEQP